MKRSYRHKIKKSKSPLVKKSRDKYLKQTHWSALIRSIDRKNIPFILRDNAMIPPRLETPKWQPVVYTHYFDSSLDKYTLKNWKFGGDLVLVIDTNILKDKPFVICKEMQGGRCLDKTRSKEERDKWTIMKSKGSLKRKPSMKPISDYFKFLANEQYIDMKMYPEPGSIPTRGFDLANSHEVLFKEIPLSYVRGVIVETNKDKKIAEKSFPYLPVILIDKSNNDSEYIQNTILPVIRLISNRKRI